MIVALDAGNFGTAGANEVKSVVNTVRYGTILGTSQLQNFINVGLKVNLLFPGASATGGYNTGGVRTINADSWASSVLSYYQAHCTPTNTPIIEVLNEPGGTWFWGVAAQADADNYARILKATWTAFHNAYGASAPLILASYDGGNSSGSSWGQMWWNSSAVSGIAGFVDGVTTHPYGGTQHTQASADGRRSLVTAAHTATNKPMYLTEIGWPTATSQPPTGDSAQWTETEQVQNINNFMAWAAGTGYVAEVVYFNYRDFNPPSNAYGITRADGSAKPSKAALHQASLTYDTGGGTPPPPVQTTIQVNPSNNAQFQITAIPSGTQLLHLHYAQDLNGAGDTFPGAGTDPGSAGSGLSAPFSLPITLTPPASTPAVQVLAYDSTAYSGGAPSGNALGQWTPFVLTTPTTGSQVPVATTDAATVTGNDVVLNGHGDLKGQTSGSFQFQVQQIVGGQPQQVMNYPPALTALTGGGTLTSPTIVSAGVASGTHDSSGSITITKPASQWADGQKLLLFLETKASGTNDPAPGGVSGWTLWGAQNFQVANLDRTIKLSLYTRTASSEPASYTFTQTEALSIAGTIIPIANFGSIDSGSKFKVNGSGQSFPLDSTVADHNADLLLGVSCFPNGENVTWSGATEDTDVKSGTTTASAALSVAHKAITADGTVGTITATSDNTNATGNDTSCTLALVLSPAAASAATIQWPANDLAVGLYQYALLLQTPAGTNVDPTPVTFLITGAPTISEATETSVTDTAVTLEADIDPNGVSTTPSLEYGRTTTSTQTITLASIGTTASHLIQVIPGLLPDTDYVARWKATNTTPVTTTGAWIPFHTLATATAPTADTLGGLRDKLKKRGANHIDDDRLDGWLNFAYHEILDYADWPFLEVDATGDSPLPIQDLGHVLSVVDSTNQNILWGEDRQTLLQEAGGDLTITGTPKWFYLDDTTVNVLPVQTVTLDVHYLRDPGDMVEDTDSPIIPAKYQKLIVDGAYLEVLKDADNFDELAQARADFTLNLDRMLSQLMFRQAANPEQTIVRGE